MSDYYALVVRNSVADCGLKPFRTFDMWQQEVGWVQDVGNGNNQELVKLKLKKVKKEVKSWYAKVFHCEKLKNK